MLLFETCFIYGSFEVFSFCRRSVSHRHIKLFLFCLLFFSSRLVSFYLFIYDGVFLFFFRSRKTHPGSVVHLSDNPQDPSKLLIGYETGQIVLWDLRTKAADMRWNSTEPLRSISWHHEGKQFICSHTDGSLTTWNVRQGPKPVNVNFPHG